MLHRYRSIRFRSPLLEVLIVGLTGLTPFLWFRAPWLMNGNDTSWPSNAGEWFAARLFMWDPRDNGGHDFGSSVAGLEWHALQTLLAHTSLSPTLQEKAFLSFWYVAAGLSMYAAMRYFTRDAIATYVGVLLYQFNPVLITGALYENASVSNIAVYAVTPALAASLVATMRRDVPLLRGVGTFGLLALVASPVGMLPPLLIALFLVLATITLVVFALNRGPSRLRRFGIGATALAASYVAVNLFWIVPLGEYILNTVRESGGTSLNDFGYPDWVVSQTAHDSLFVVLRMLGSWDWFQTFAGAPFDWYADTYLHQPAFVAIGTIIFLGSIMAVTMTRFRRHRTVAIASTAVVALCAFFSAGAHAPTGTVFLWLHTHVPGFQVIRSPWFMFEQFLPLAYGIGFGLAVSEVVRRGPRLTRSLVTATAVVSILVYAFPLLNGAFLKPGRENIPGFVVRYPWYVPVAARYLAGRTGRYLAFPILSLSPSIFAWRDGPFISSSPITGLFTSRPMAWLRPAGATALSKRRFNAMLQTALQHVLAENPAAAGDLRTLGISDLLVQHDAWIDLGGARTISAAVWEAAIRRIPGVIQTAHFGPWDVYSLSYRGLLQVADTVAIGDLPLDEIGTWEGAEHIPYVRADDAAKVRGITDPTYVRARPLPEPDALVRYLRMARSVHVATVTRGTGAIRGTIAAAGTAESRERVAVLFSLNRTSIGDTVNRPWIRPSRVGTFGSDSVRLQVIDQANGTELLSFENDGSPARVTVQMNSGADVVPDTAAAGFISWSARGGLLVVWVPTGSSSRTIGISDGMVSGQIMSVASMGRVRSVRVHGSARRVGNSTLVHLLLPRGISEQDEAGVAIPLRNGIDLDSMPILDADVAFAGTTPTFARVRFDITMLDGTKLREYVSLQGRTHVDVVAEFDRRLRSTWLRESMLRRGDRAWTDEHRLPERVEGGKADMVLEIGKPAGARVVDPTVNVRIAELTLTGTNVYAPVDETDLNLNPMAARWTGIVAPATVHMFDSTDGTIVIPPRPVIDFADYNGDAARLAAGVRYAFVLSTGEKFDGQVLSATRADVRVRVDAGNVRDLARASITSLATPSVGGRLFVRAAVKPVALDRRRLSISYRPGGSLQNLAVNLEVALGNGVRRVVEADTSVPNAGLRGVSQVTVSSVASQTGAFYDVKRMLSLPSGVVAPEGRELSVDLGQLARVEALGPHARLVAVDIQINAASEGIVLGRVRITCPVGPGCPASRGDTVAIDSAASRRAEVYAIPVVRASPTHVVADLAARDRARLVILDEAFNPSWRATLSDEVGSRTLRHVEVNGWQNGWVVPAGARGRLNIRYGPQALYVAAIACSTVSALFLVLLAAFWRVASRWPVIGGPEQ